MLKRVIVKLISAGCAAFFNSAHTPDLTVTPRNQMGTKKEQAGCGSGGPIFIVGMNGSGTTMVLDHMDRHPHLYGFPLESYVLPLYIKRAQEYGDLQQRRNFLRLWDDMRSEYAFVMANHREVLELPPHWEKAPRSVSGVFDTIMTIFASRDGKMRWCEKTPMHVFYISELAELFPTSQFIHVIRDGRDCAASCRRRWGTHPVGAAARWRDTIRAGRKAGESLHNRYFEVIYEEVTAEPEKVLRNVCEYIEEDFSEAVLEARRVRPRMTGHGSPVIELNKSNRTILDEGKYAERIERIAGKALHECGYPCKYPCSEGHVNWLDKLIWVTTDARNFLARMIKRKAGAKRDLSWMLLWSKIVTTARTKLARKKRYE
jgi:hypothetical protein